MLLMSDWPTFVTGVVGLAGIGGTILGVRMTIRAETARAERAEKRRIYATFHSSVETVAAICIMTPNVNQDDFRTSLVALHQVTGEVRLIAPAIIGEMVEKTAKALSDAAQAAIRGQDFDPKLEVRMQREKLYNIMRADLDKTR